MISRDRDRERERETKRKIEDEGKRERESTFKVIVPSSYPPLLVIPLSLYHLD